MDRRGHSVSPAAAVLVDQDQPYEMEFEARSPSQSFCLFFSKALVADAWASLAAGCEPEPDDAAPGGFPNVVFAPSGTLTRRLARLHADGPDACAEGMESRLLEALAEAVATARRHRRVAARVPAVKPATRAHVLGLLERGRERIIAAEGVGVSLEVLATEVGLSKFHFLRLFKAAYGQSPLAFAEQRRMAAAARRLASSPAPILQVAGDLGYDSPSAFARAFRRHQGAAPAAFRTEMN
jgi:AraC-like DNA-binding protein